MPAETERSASMNIASVALTCVDATVTSHESALQLLQMLPRVETVAYQESSIHLISLVL